jgi:DNA polymerase III alpha subunit (gram-positive type)
MPEGICFFDFETSGLDYRRHAIIQAAWCIEVEGKTVSQKAFDVLPPENADFCLAALDCNDFTLERMAAGRSLSYVMASLKGDLIASSCTMVRPCGHNVKFDLEFLHKASADTNERIGSQLKFGLSIDTLSIATVLDYLQILNLPNYKLTTLCSHYGIVLDGNAHDALTDTLAVQALLPMLLKDLRGYVPSVRDINTALKKER